MGWDGGGPGPTGTHRLRLAVALLQLQARLPLPLRPHGGVEGLSPGHTVPQARELVPVSWGRHGRQCRDPAPPAAPRLRSNVRRHQRGVGQASQAGPRASSSVQARASQTGALFSFFFF